MGARGKGKRWRECARCGGEEVRREERRGRDEGHAEMRNR